MTVRGYSVLALASALLLLLALGQSVAGVALENWYLMADALVMAVASLTLAVLSAMDG